MNSIGETISANFHFRRDVDERNIWEGHVSDVLYEAFPILIEFLKRAYKWTAFQAFRGYEAAGSKAALFCMSGIKVQPEASRPWQSGFSVHVKCESRVQEVMFEQDNNPASRSHANGTFGNNWNGICSESEVIENSCGFLACARVHMFSSLKL